MSAPHVLLRSVTKTYGPVRALVGVTARVDAGKVTVITGPNGSGKSTLLALIGTLARPTSGRVVHEGLGRGRAEVRRTVGWLGHDALCYADLTGRENVELAAALHGLDPRAAFEAARARFDLGAFAERPFRTYSRGQRQRVALARALVHAPQLLLLDEPTTGLDHESIRRLGDVLREEAGRGAIIVAVTHDASFADAAGTRLALERGRLVSPASAS